MLWLFVSLRHTIWGLQVLPKVDEELKDCFLPCFLFPQARIAEFIEKSNVMENFEQAWEHSPEVFGQVIMLYNNMEVNGTPLKAFVDSGAQVGTLVQPGSCGKKSLGK